MTKRCILQNSNHNNNKNVKKRLEIAAMIISFASYTSILLHFPLQLLLPSVVEWREREGVGYCIWEVCAIFPAAAVYWGLEDCYLCLHSALCRAMSLL